MHAPSKKNSGRLYKSNDIVEVWLQLLEFATRATKIR
jgi:hypothetical protein